MIDLANFCKKIEQTSVQHNIEPAPCKAIKFDDNDGWVQSLPTNYANYYRVDYFEIIESGLIMIELKHIKLKIQHLLNKGENKKSIREKILLNIDKKFTDSLRIIQYEINEDLIPTTNYLVVSNETENNILDKYLPNNLKKKPFVICKTNEICNKLSRLDTRLCQD